MTPSLYIHDLAGAQIDGSSVGTILRDPTTWSQVQDAILAGIQSTEPQVWGGIFVQLPPETFGLLYAGAIPKPDSTRDSDFVIRTHREIQSMYFRRDLVSPDALEPQSAMAIVYTAEAFLADPEVTPEEIADFKSCGATHGLINIVATGGTPTKPETGCTRFVKGLAGGNKAYETMSKEDLVALAKRVAAYGDAFFTVG
tara:strand:- start:297 stop:893 length:597 start_codon:yes stop_codon:yes gene_type:complete